MIKMSLKWFIKARRKWAKKKIKYFCIVAKDGSFISRSYDEKMIIDIKDNLNSTIILKFHMLKDLNFYDACYFALTMLTQSENRSLFEFGFETHFGETIGIIKSMIRRAHCEEILSIQELKQSELDSSADENGAGNYYGNEEILEE